SVFNLFVVSVFWAFMVDVFTTEQSKRLFGFIAAAATLGGILGSSITATTVKTIGVPALLLISAALLELGVFAAKRLGALNSGFATTAARKQTGEPDTSERVIGGSALAGLTGVLRSPYLLQIGVYMLLYTILSTFLYF